MVQRKWGHGSGPKAYKNEPDNWNGEGEEYGRAHWGKYGKNPESLVNELNPSGQLAFWCDINGGGGCYGQQTDCRYNVSAMGNQKMEFPDGSKQTTDGCVATYQYGGMNTNMGNLDTITAAGHERINQGHQTPEAQKSGGRGGDNFTTRGYNQYTLIAGNEISAGAGDVQMGASYYSGTGKGAVAGPVVEGAGKNDKGYRIHVSHGKKGMTQLSMRGDGTTVIAVGNVKNDNADYTLTIDPQGNMTIKTKGTITVESEGTHTIKAPKVIIDAPIETTSTIKSDGNHTAPKFRGCATSAEGCPC